VQEFVVKRWLNSKDGLSVCLSPDGLSGSTDLVPVCDYVVTTFTSDIRGAGTDANVFIKFRGEKDGKMMELGEHRLENSANNFERGKKVGAPAGLCLVCIQKEHLNVLSNVDQDLNHSAAHKRYMS
jgi:hypothetical protein